MISVFVKEQKRYTLDELSSLLRCNLEKIRTYIKILKQYGVIKAVKANKIQRDMSDLNEQDIEIENTLDNNSDYYYVFTFVGVISAFGRILKCYPKYVSNDDEKYLTHHLKNVLRVLQKHNSNEQIIKMASDGDAGHSFNLLAVILYLLQDYYESGLYTNEVNVVETNGTGEVLWDKTINNSFVYR